MNWCSRVIFPCIYDWLMDTPFLAKRRKEQLADVGGEVLEIGIGTGLNLPHYPKRVRRITTVEPNPGMNRKLRRRMRETGIDVDQHLIGAEGLPFADGTFDSIVSTLVLCSIRNVEPALREVLRVLKDGGRFFFFEHGVSPDPGVSKWQRRLNWLQKLLADGCTLTLDVGALLAAQPFRSVEIESFYLEQTPKTHGYVYRGTATK